MTEGNAASDEATVVCQATVRLTRDVFDITVGQGQEFPTGSPCLLRPKKQLDFTTVCHEVCGNRVISLDMLLANFLISQ